VSELWSWLPGILIDEIWNEAYKNIAANAITAKE
jgi:hypothetical protein